VTNLSNLYTSANVVEVVNDHQSGSTDLVSSATGRHLAGVLALCYVEAKSFVISTQRRLNHKDNKHNDTQSAPGYGGGIICKCLGPTTSKGPMKDGCKIF